MEGVAADAAQALGGQLEAALALVDEPGLLQHPGEVGQLVEAAGRLVAEQLAGPVDVDLGQGAGLGRAPEQLLEPVEVAQLLQRRRGLGEAERVLPAEVVAPVPAHVGEHAAQLGAELVDLPAQVHVVEQLLGQLGDLRPLLGRHRRQHRLHGGHAPGQHLEQLVEGLGVLGEEVAVALHEPLEVGLAPAARASSIWLSSASMSLMRAMSSGVMPSTAPDMRLTYESSTCWRSRSTSSSNRCWPRPR